jgi:hypothetical protein
MPVIPALERLRQESYKFEANQGYIETCFQNKQKPTNSTSEMITVPEHCCAYPCLNSGKPGIYVCLFMTS